MSGSSDILVLSEDLARWDDRLVERATRRFSPPTCARGRNLLTAGRVSQITVGPDFIEARVAGESVVESAVWHRLEDEILLECSCGSAPDCEHLAAILEVLREHQGRAVSGVVPREAALPADAAPLTLAALCVILEPWNRRVRFLREEGGSGHLQSVEVMTLREVFDPGRGRYATDSWSSPDRELITHLRTMRCPPESWNSREWRPDPDRFAALLSALAGHPRLFDHHGRALQVVPAPVEPSIRLSMKGAELWAAIAPNHSQHAASPASRRGWSIVGDGYRWDDPRSLERVRGELRDAGFLQGEDENSFSLPSSLLDHWLGNQLPRWQAQGREVLLAGDVRRLVEGGCRIRSKFQMIATKDIDWFEISWRLQAGEEILNDADIRALRVFPGRFFRLASGRVVSVERGAIRRQLDGLLRMGFSPTRPGPQRLPVRFLASLVDLTDPSHPEDLEITPELERLYCRLKNRTPLPESPPPEALRGVLRTYQLEGFRFLHFLQANMLGGVLADDMGLGKTVQSLALIQHLRDLRGPGPSLVVCPTSVAPNWLEEAEKFLPQLRVVHLQNGVQMRDLDPTGYDLIVVSYGLLQRHPLSHRFRCLILDEAQNIKNPRAQRTRAVKRLAGDFRLALTGTPIENHVTEIWSLFDFLLPGLLGSATGFQRHYGKPIMKDHDERALQRLTEVVRPFILRRLKSQVAPELPEKVEQNVYCDLTSRQKKIYREVAARVRGEVTRHVQIHGVERSRIPILSALMRLRQLCCHPVLIDPELANAGSGKLEAFCEQLEAILSGEHRVIVFSQFVAMLSLLKAELIRRGIDFLYLDGATRDRGREVRRFQEGSHHQVFLMSLKAGGTGLNLTGADYVILYEPWWNPAVEQQAIDRIHRIGQRKPVTAYRLIVRGTVEEKMLELHRRKQFLAESLLESRLDTATLLTLLTE